MLQGQTAWPFEDAALGMVSRKFTMQNGPEVEGAQGCFCSSRCVPCRPTQTTAHRGATPGRGVKAIRGASTSAAVVPVLPLPCSLGSPKLLAVTSLASV